MENNITLIDEGSVSKYCKNSNAFWYAKLYKREDYRIESNAYIFDSDSVMNLLCDLNQDYFSLNKSDVDIIDYDNKTNRMVVNVKIKDDYKIETFIYRRINKPHKITLLNWNNDYNEERDEYVGWGYSIMYASITGNIYDTILKWWFERKKMAYDGMSKKDFRLIRVHRSAGNYMIFHNYIRDVYLRIKVLKADEKTPEESKIQIRFILKDEFPIRYKKDRVPYFIDAEKIKELAILTEVVDDALNPKGVLGVADGIIEVRPAKYDGPYSYYEEGCGFYKGIDRHNPTFIAVCKSIESSDNTDQK
jgi:hypothetical protein